MLPNTELLEECYSILRENERIRKLTIRYEYILERLGQMNKLLKIKLNNGELRQLSQALESSDSDSSELSPSLTSDDGELYLY